jgi:hypothetical protein
MTVEPLEKLLRPCPPSEALRERVLRAAGLVARQADSAELATPRRRRALELAWRLATALALLGHLWVSFASERFEASVRNRFSSARLHSVLLSFDGDAER